MALRFRIERTKGAPRIAVLRVTKQSKGKEELKQIGAFGQRKPPDLLWDKLTEDEQYELENFLSELEFSKQFFNTEADRLDRFIIRVAPKFQEALLALWKQAKKYDLEFIPEKEMLYAILNKSKEIENKINRIVESKVNILERIGIDINEVSEPSTPDLESKKLFQAMLDMNIPLETLSKEFETIAREIYQKKTHFEPHYFKYYADPTVIKSFPKWYYTIAVDLLQKHGINPIDVVSPQKVAKHWARLRVNQMTLAQAKELFIKQFTPPENLQNECAEAITIVYLKQKDKKETSKN